MPELTVVIPTLGRSPALPRVLDRLAGAEVVVVADAAAPADVAADLRAAVPGASAARNAGWRAASSPLVLFLGDDILAGPGLVDAHLARHRAEPDDDVAVVGHVAWARELRPTPFMRWLDGGIQFDFAGIRGEDAGWARFYTANASVKRAALERAGGFDEDAFPFLYEDLDLARRAGLRVRYAPGAAAEHLHPATLEGWRARMAQIAVAERRFVERHGGAPHFHGLLGAAAAIPPGRGWGARLARVVPRRTPVVGDLVWGRADVWWRQQLAAPFMAAWDRSTPAPAPAPPPPR
jgi:glycosyltransferase involved in cell wall biosynthesis